MGASDGREKSSEWQRYTNPPEDRHMTGNRRGRVSGDGSDGEEGWGGVGWGDG